jgi:hypothetical protein
VSAVADVPFDDHASLPFDSLNGGQPLLAIAVGGGHIPDVQDQLALGSDGDGSLGAVEALRLARVVRTSALSSACAAAASSISFSAG